MARALAHSPRHHSRHFPRYHLSSQAQHRQGTQTCYASSVVLRIFAPCFDSVHLICWNLTIFTLLQIADPHRTKRGNNAPPTHYDFFHYVCPHSLRNAWGLLVIFRVISLSPLKKALPLPRKQSHLQF